MTCRFGIRTKVKSVWFTTKFSRLEHLFTKQAKFGEFTRPCNLEFTVAYATLKFDPAMTILSVIHPPVPVSNSKGSVIGSVIGQVPIWTTVIWSPAEASALPDDSGSGSNKISGSYKCVTAAFDKLESSFLLNFSAPIDNFDSLSLKFRGRLGDRDILVSDSESIHGASVALSLVAKHANAPFAWAGDVVWTVTVEASGQVIPLESTRVEIYAVSSRTAEAVFFKTTPVPVRLLRRIVYPATADYISYLVKTLFYDFGFIYESVSGGTHGDLNHYGGPCRLDDWIDHTVTPTRSKDRHNCYDIAGMVQTCLPFLLGNPKKLWAYLEPYGFIKETNLIGWGPCNNPLFEAKRNPKEHVVVRANASDPPPPRSGFGNHAFIVLPDDSVVDVTSGPHFGDEKLSEYLDNSIDKDLGLYKPGAHPKTWGTAHGVAYYEGVTSIGTYHGPVSHPKEAPASKEVAKQMQVAAVPNAPSVSHSNSHLHQIPDSMLSALPGSAFGKPHRTYVTHTSSQAHWDVVLDNNAGVRAVVDVCGDHDAAVQAMTRHLGTYQHGPDEVFKAPDAGRTHGQYSLESIAPGYAVIWV
ncbi:hypothetical protein BOTBODRAFT_448586 [Botryobasidium botryosum FD-172 SS1]|uniref:Uncharacterized protein n=1 Tax=Botryobasidium botryosum (strain FD-172 SS1) TaxID=930990 RepID=A0A067MAD2_BOTB1|nr:hypothetical protein BOTBODRAFT_448586 [Botryobasidium botryosum FD-172 SS1]